MQINYELSGDDIDNKYFQVDMTEGTVTVKDSLIDVPRTDFVVSIFFTRICYVL